MIQGRLAATISIITLLCVSLCRGADESLFVCRLDPVGADESIALTATTLLVQGLETHGDYSRVLKGTIPCLTEKDARLAGLEAETGLVLYGTIDRLGIKHIVSVQLLDTTTGKREYSGSLSAAQPEELELVCDQLAMAIVLKQPPRSIVEVGKVRDEEVERVSKRREAFITAGLKFGWGSIQDGYGGAKSIVAFDWVSYYETERYMAEFLFGIRTTPIETSISVEEGANEEEIDISAFHMVLPGIGFYYLFSSGDFSPYAGANLGMHWLQVYESGEGLGFSQGLGLEFAAGLMAFRTYDFHLLVECRYSMCFADVKGYDGPHQRFDLNFGLTYNWKKRGCRGGCLPGL
jgi:hypothetical protein